MCDCIKKTTEIIQERIKLDTEAKTDVAEWIDEGRFYNIGYSMTGGDTKIAMPFVATYVRRKINGEPERKETNLTVNMYATYCPFCGKKYDEK